MVSDRLLVSTDWFFVILVLKLAVNIVSSHTQSTVALLVMYGCIL